MKELFLITPLLLFFLTSVFGSTELSNNLTNCSQYESVLDSILFYEAPFNHEYAYDLYENIKKEDCECLAHAYNLLSFFYYNSSDLDEAKKYLVQGEKTFITQNSKQKYYAYNQTLAGLIFIIEKNYESALYHFQKALDIAEKINNKDLLIVTNQNMGLVKLERNELDEAQFFFEKSLSFNNSINKLRAYANQNQARVLVRMNKLDEALQQIDKTKQVWRELHHSKGIYLISMVEAKVYLSKKQYKQTLQVLYEGRAAVNGDMKLLAGENYLLEAKSLAVLEQKEGEFKALQNALLNNEDLDISDVEKAINRIAEITGGEDQTQIIDTWLKMIKKYDGEIVNNTELSITKNKVLDNQIEQKNTIESDYLDGVRVIKNQYIFIFVLFALISILAYLLYTVRKQKQKIQNLNQDLITSQNQIEQQIEKLKEKNNELRQFAYVASHDLKSPLANITAFAGILEKKMQDEQSKKYLGFIKTSAQDMTLMISDLLQHSTIDQKLNIEKVNFTDLIETTIQRLSNDIKQSNATIVFDNEASHTVFCDKLKLTTVLQNLISNAINYSKKDTRPIIEIKSFFEKNNNFQLSVADNGIGMKQENTGNIFKMFHRLNDKKVSGTGIGLATCKKIIDLHRGQISVTSEYMKGSTFIIEIPNKRNIN